MENSALPFNLTLAHGDITAELDLTSLLYRGGAAANKRAVDQEIRDKKFGPPRIERLGLVTKIFDVLEGRLVSGKSYHTIQNNVSCIRAFYAWADTERLDINEGNVTRCFIDWADYLIQRQRVDATMKRSSAFGLASKVSTVLNEVMNVRVGLLYLTRLKKTPIHIKALSTKSEKQNLSDLLTQGHALVDIVKGLSLESVRGVLPVIIELRTGKRLEEWSGLIAEGNLKPNKRPSSWKSRLKRCSDISWASRYPLINLRLEAELLIFIAQTGMNLAQACKLKVSRFSYQSDTGGYLVRRVYKNRKQGEVEFHVYSEYRKHLEDFLSWRAEIFQDDEEELLFPIRSPKGRPIHIAPQFSAVRKRFRAVEIKYIGPRELRKSRINWLLRHDLSESLVSTMHQHTESTLIRNYIRPHHQVAIVEVSRFFASVDPTLKSAGPGFCLTDKPMIAPTVDSNAPQPDCINPAGCLFCENHRDVESFDHIWSLVTYRHCKSIELSKVKITKSEDHPALMTVETISMRLRHFKDRNQQTSGWLEEAELRVEEGVYHPAWDAFIQIMEG